MNLKYYFGSMAGRLFIFLLIGVIGSASLALGAADMRRQSDLRRIGQERLADRLQDYVSLTNSASGALRARLIADGVPGLLPIRPQQKIEGVDGGLSQRLSRRIGVPVRAERIDLKTCFFAPSMPSTYRELNCWRVSSRLADGEPFALTMIAQHAQESHLTDVEPIYVLVLLLGVGVLTFLAARMAAAPLGDLSRAARALGSDLDTLPLPERGPYDVREAIQAFNTMQTKLREHMMERTKILASITHDLQTPLTRLRLRLEKVENVALRSRLIDDLQGMQILIREGLEFSRGTQIDEPFAAIALDSLLESLVHDAEEQGQSAVFLQRSSCDVEARPRALQRCLANLIDNAVKHGGSAEVTATLEGGAVKVSIRDHGPGIPPKMLEAVFQPFVRIEADGPRRAEGAGLGLTIARMLASKTGAELTLSNPPDGGLEAVLTLTRGVTIHDVDPGQASLAEETAGVTI
jgi:signal transduction histidine kinase